MVPPRTHKTLTVGFRWVSQHNEEYEEVKKTRRPGRPASAREDLLKMAIAALEKEYKEGFCECCLKHSFARPHIS